VYSTEDLPAAVVAAAITVPTMSVQKPPQAQRRPTSGRLSASSVIA